MTTNIYAATDNDDLSDMEHALYRLIMDYRAENGLPEIPLSKSLTLTAGRHAVDTYDNIWLEGVTLPAGANLHSWSDAFYYGDHRSPEIMWQAPQRLGTEYPGSGYEISAAGYADVAAALAGWKTSAGHNNVILNLGGWANLDWGAIGVGVEHHATGGPYGGKIYHVWFGAEADPAGAPAFDNGMAPIAGLDLIGTDGADLLRGGDLDDRLDGRDGNDVLSAGAGDDALLGGAGFDRLNGGTGADRMEGGAGNDIYTVDAVDDVVLEAADGGLKDRVNVFVDYTNPENVEYLVGVFAARGLALTGSDARESITGANRIGSGDRIDARGGNDRIVGLVGDDDIKGGAGADRIFGNSGQDRIAGGDGADRLTGQFGADRFVHAPGDDADRITDFRPGEDMLDLTGHGLTDFAAFQLRIVDTNAGALVDLGAGDQVLLEGVASSALGQADVIL